MSIDNSGVLLVGKEINSDLIFDSNIWGEYLLSTNNPDEDDFYDFFEMVNFVAHSQKWNIGEFNFGSPSGYERSSLFGFYIESGSYKFDKMDNGFVIHLTECQKKFIELFSCFPDFYLGNVQS